MSVSVYRKHVPLESYDFAGMKKNYFVSSRP